MSRVAAVQEQLEAIVKAIEPETKGVFPRFQLGDHATFGTQDAGGMVHGRRFIVSPTGDVTWTGVYTQDREGLILVEGFSIQIVYPPSMGRHRMDVVIRQDALRIQYELLAPDNWDDDAHRCSRRETGQYLVTEDDEESDQSPILVTIPVKCTYQPF